MHLCFARPFCVDSNLLKVLFLGRKKAEAFVFTECQNDTNKVV